MVPPRRKSGRFGWASLLTLLLMVLGAGPHGVAEASALEQSRFEVGPELDVQHAAAVPEPAQWRAALNDAPSCEFPALEPETNEDPAGPDAPSIVRPEFVCAGSLVPPDLVLQADPVAYTARLAASRVLARAPPRVVR